MRLRQDVKLKLYCMLLCSIMSYAKHKPPFHGGSLISFAMVRIRVLSTLNAAAVALGIVTAAITAAKCAAVGIYTATAAAVTTARNTAKTTATTACNSCC